jgi:hypothetical protein
MAGVRRWAGLRVVSVVAGASALLMGGVLASSAAPPPVTFSPSSFNYEQVAVGQTPAPTKTFTLANAPGAKATGALTVTVPGSAEFSITADACTGRSLGPGKSCTVTVQFAPTAAGTVTATLTAVNNKNAVQATANLSGTGTAPANTVTVTNPGNQTSIVGSTVSLQIMASDSDSAQTLTYSATGLPAGLSIDASGPTAGLIHGMPNTVSTYSVTVSATDGTGAHGSASFMWTVNAAGPPTAVNQSYNAVGNTPLAVGTTVTGPAATVSGGSLLNGDSGDAGCGTLTVTGNTVPANGTVGAVNADGTFTYTPNAGFSGTDTFQYTITCSTSKLTATATVTITVGQLVWYVDNSSTTVPATGQSTAPFTTLAAAESAAGANSNSIIFLYAGNATYTGGLTMQSGQDLWGQPHGLIVDGYTLVAKNPSGSNPTITNTSGDGIDLASNVDVEDVTVSDPSAIGINGQQVSGSISVIGCTITGSGGNSSSNDTGNGVDIAPLAGGTTTITIENNNIQTQATVYGILVDPGGGTTLTGTLSGTISGNTVGSPTVTNSGGSVGINVEAEGSFTETVAITSNNLYQYRNDAGINFLASKGSPTMNLTITGNTIADPGDFGTYGLLGTAGAQTGDAGTVCADITGNSVTGSAHAGQGGADITVDDEFGVTFELPGYTAAATDTGMVASFLAGKNTPSGGTAPSGLAMIGNGGAGFTNTSGGAACPTP